MNWTPSASALTTDLTQWVLPHRAINPRRQLITSRLLVESEPVDTSETMHLLLPPSEVEWIVASASSVSTTAGAATDESVSVTVENTGDVPLFYTLMTSSFEGRFSHNVFTVPAHSSRNVDFFFADGGARPKSGAEFQQSLRMQWLNMPLASEPTARDVQERSSVWV